MNRDRYISQLRKLADLLEANESLPLPDNGNLPPTPPSYLPDPSAPAQPRVPPPGLHDLRVYPARPLGNAARVSLADHLAHAIAKVLKP